ncbi:RNA-directed DNA polymerase (reverse transcriptase) [Thioalkalivibrio sulfidiphilus HL-EbGr7]|uniref:RNA-directed DNA polymerase (Reverse transcriptase) n=1 Tax=Thioalkalivibrio sulfidiphilus (strain HL-EbGR7) TaxID=396588 RepID=B8GRZ4_THISH|nr:RNA-directed DNA polymerase [Thioalkalivibrio sulfidiphilus]ACL72698.1 RNA-directed DNA polymerase (reverse transcriptase) [Thioalkalivibrio sulfidiphilus HL-EbGr7]
MRAEYDRPGGVSSESESPARSHFKHPNGGSVGKRHKRLIEAIVDWDNLQEAHRLARRGKRDRHEVATFEANLWEELGALQMEMLWGSYQPGRYRSFLVYEPKRREILAAPYRDRVAQHAICTLCGPIWDAAMIDDSYACRPGKGTHVGATRVEQWLRGMTAAGGAVWVVKMDVSKYFASIRHDLAKAVVRDKISCPATLQLIDAIIDSTADPADPDPVGIPVGNLLSQWIANLVGNRIDQWAKRELRLKRYARYMDDMVVLVRTKQEALTIRDQFDDKLASMGMRFSKASVLPASRGVNFLGYRIWAHKRLLRRDSVRRIKRNLKAMRWQYARGGIGLEEVRQRVASWVAHADHADTETLKRRVLSQAVFKRRSRSD